MRLWRRSRKIRFAARKAWIAFAPQYRHQCLKCGFLAFRDGTEATAGSRVTLEIGPSAGWWKDEAPITCSKDLWDWEFADDAPINILLHESQRQRWHCRGFHRYAPGRTPAEHKVLEDKRAERRHQWWLALVSFLGGVLVGWLSKP
jgi:hypothetical protein